MARIKRSLWFEEELWKAIDLKRGDLLRDEFIAKILTHALGFSHGGFGEKL